VYIFGNFREGPGLGNRKEEPLFASTVQKISRSQAWAWCSKHRERTVASTFASNVHAVAGLGSEIITADMY